MKFNTLELHHPPCCEKYLDLQTKEVEESHYFFLEKLLQARIDLHLDTGRHEFDEEVSVYLAHLMQTLFNSADLTHTQAVLSPFDFEIRKYLDEHPGLRNEYIVYKENADFGLISCGVFTDYEHDGSYHTRFLADTDYLPRIGLYYRIAGQILIHLRGSHDTLAKVLIEIGENIAEVTTLLRKVSGDYFEIRAQLSAGSLFHLQKEVKELSEHKSFPELLDDFLKEFADFKRAPQAQKRTSLLAAAVELARLNPQFHFDEHKLDMVTIAR